MASESPLAPEWSGAYPPGKWPETSMPAGDRQGHAASAGSGGEERDGQAGALEASRHRVGRVPGIVRRLVGRGADGARGDGRLVGAGHPCARDHVGGGGPPLPAPHPGRWHAAKVPDHVRRHRRLQRPDDGAEERVADLRGPETGGRDPPPAHRSHPERAGRPVCPRDTLSPSAAARYLPPLPTARGSDTAMARTTRGSVRTYTLLGSDRRLYQSAMPGTLGGHRPGRRYGRLDCAAARRAIARGGYVKHRVFFADEQTAIAAGYRPCGVYLPAEYARWKARKGQTR